MGEAGALRHRALLCACHQRWDLLRPLLDASTRRGDSAAAYALGCSYAEGIGGAPELALAVTISRSDAALTQYLFKRLYIHFPKQYSNTTDELPLTMNC